MTCPHEHIEEIFETEDLYSDGTFGLPASNLPLSTELVNIKRRCLDCGNRLNILNQSIVPRPL